MRHCDACSAAEDPERPLTETGLADAHKLADHLQYQNCHIASTMHSGIKRAQQTAEIIALVCGSESITAAPNYLGHNASIEETSNLANSLVEDTLFVSHMPFIAEFVSHLITDAGASSPLVSFPPGTIVCLKRSDESWLIDWMLKPENLA